MRRENLLSGIGFKCDLAFEHLDDSSTGRLMLAVLGGLADVERDLIRTRTAEGRARAKAQGKAMGRPPSHAVAEERGHQAARAGRYA